MTLVIWNEGYAEPCFFIGDDSWFEFDREVINVTKRGDELADKVYARNLDENGDPIWIGPPKQNIRVLRYEHWPSIDNMIVCGEMY